MMILRFDVQVVCWYCRLCGVATFAMLWKINQQMLCRSTADLVQPANPFRVVHTRGRTQRQQLYKVHPPMMHDNIRQCIMYDCRLLLAHPRQIEPRAHFAYSTHIIESSYLHLPRNRRRDYGTVTLVRISIIDRKPLFGFRIAIHKHSRPIHLHRKHKQNTALCVRDFDSIIFV